MVAISPLYALSYTLGLALDCTSILAAAKNNTT